MADLKYKKRNKEGTDEDKEGNTWNKGGSGKESDTGNTRCSGKEVTTEDLANKEVVVAPETKVGQLINRSTWPDFSCCSEDIFICFILTSSLAPCILKLDTMSSVHPAWTSTLRRYATEDLHKRSTIKRLRSIDDFAGNILAASDRNI